MSPPKMKWWLFLVFNGAARGIRTPDPLITNEVLYQLSYCGITRNGVKTESLFLFLIASLDLIGNRSLVQTCSFPHAKQSSNFVRGRDRGRKRFNFDGLWLS